MSKKLFLLLSIGLLSVNLFACNKKAEEAVKTSETAPITETKTETEEAIKPGEVPFDFPEIATEAKTGEYVLAPSRVSIDSEIKDYKKDKSQAGFVFYNATVVAPGEIETKVKELLEETMIPNSLIIPIKAGQTAKTGDLVLTWWQSGSGMKRAMVIEGGKEPKIFYLDDTNSEDTLKADSFNILSTDWQTGTSVACKETSSDTDYTLAIAVNASSDKILTIGWGGIMTVYTKSNCLAVPRTVNVKAGDKIYVAPYSTFKEATVVSVDASKGLVKASYEFGGEMTEEDFSFGDILLSLT